jgi:3-phosphoshikimate 1-carboxyvinyltransferase
MVKIRGDISSQFLSSILLVASAFETSVEITLEGKLVSGPYVEMTTDLMRKWDLAVQSSSEGFRIFQQSLSGFDFEMEADASAAVYWWAMEYLHECVINVLNVQNDSKQGDMQFKKVLHMLKTCSSSFEIDMNDMPDAALALMAVAPFHHSEVVIKNIGNLRVKESDRIDAMSRELRKCGVEVETGVDWVKVNPLHFPPPPSLEGRGGSKIMVNTYDDHRVAMSMAVFATKLGKVEILNPVCVSKSYPRFWEHLKMMY